MACEAPPKYARIPQRRVLDFRPHARGTGRLSGCSLENRFDWNNRPGGRIEEDAMNVSLWLADGVVLLHAAYVGFVIFGLLAILLGVTLHWRWVRNFWFRLAHFAAILIVALEALLGVVCPLTDLENYLRSRGGAGSESGSFIGRWLHELIVEVSETQLTVAYVAFGAVVLLVFVLAPPRWPGSQSVSRKGEP